MSSRDWVLGAAASAVMAFGCVGVAVGQEHPAVSGVVGIESETGEGWLAVRVEVPQGQALAGVSWFNNDDQAAFPQVMVATGYPQGPGGLGDAAEVASAVSGGASQWCEVTFDQPVAPSLATLYVVFAFPPGHMYSAPGSGGGMGLGYLAAASGSRGWLSGDGDTWIGLDPTHAFAMVPQFVPYQPGMLVKSLDGAGDLEFEGTAPAHPYLTAGPNPFNPRVTVEFGIGAAGKARVDVYDIAGRRVVRLLDDVVPAGQHRVEWQGRDGRGRAVASGVYFVRLEDGDGTLSRRVLLVK